MKSKRQKKYTITLSSVFILIVFFYAVYAVRYAVKAYAGIASTRHNLSAVGPGSRTVKAQSASMTETCVFCHTPHGSISTFGGGDTDHTPIWNHNLSTVANYIVPSNSGTLLSVVGQPDKGSKLCLSCHDGTVAIGAVMNTPGPGSTGTIQMLGVDGQGRLPSTNPAYLGTNISGMHAVSIAVNSDLQAAKIAQCSKVGTQGYPKIPPTLPVKLKPTNAKYKGKKGVPIQGGYGGVQCASCHDPHNDHPENGNCDITKPGLNIPCFFVANRDDDSLCIACHAACCCLDPNPLFGCPDDCSCPGSDPNTCTH